MDNRLFLCLCVILLSTQITTAQSVHPHNLQTIYGDDGRREFYQLTSEKLRTLARKSAALVSSGNIPAGKGRRVRLDNQSFGDSYHLCSEEKFFEQPSVAFCTGVLIAPEFVLTAGHCIDSKSCPETRLVFDYFISNKNYSTEISVESENIYQCESVSSKSPLDFVIVHLDRAVRDRGPVDLNPHPKLQGDLISVGFPQGIPMKIALGGRVRRETKNYVIAALDVLGGNSGSPIYDENLDLIGILLRGEKDFVFDHVQKCNKERHCSNSDCHGETVLKLSSILAHLNMGNNAN